MIRLARNLAIPPWISKDYFKKYVNWRVRNAFYDVASYIYHTQNKSTLGLLLAENTIIFPADAAEVFAKYELAYRDLYRENVFVPASLPNKKKELKEWLVKPLAELMTIMNDEEGEDTPSLEGEYLMFHILFLAANLDEAPDEEFDTSGYITKEITEIALYNAFRYLEEVEEFDEDEEAVPKADRIMKLFEMYIKAMTDLIEYSGEGSIDIYEALVWDWDYEMLDLVREIPEDLAYYWGIK